MVQTFHLPFIFPSIPVLFFYILVMHFYKNFDLKHTHTICSSLIHCPKSIAIVLGVYVKVIDAILR